MFDVNTFLDAQTTEANSTKRTPCPEGEYQAIAEKVEAKTWQSKDGTKSGVKLQIVWDIADPSVLQALDREKVTVRQDIMLDTTDSNGLDMGKGKNLGLGRLREATDLNAPGKAFSPSMIQGRMAVVKVTHRVEGEDLYDEVKAVRHP